MSFLFLIPATAIFNIVGQIAVTSVGSGCHVCSILSCLLFSFLPVTELGYQPVLGQRVMEDISNIHVGA